ncbi:MAG: NAD(P)/FAD-dependent oxidoreductase [Bacteroidota bacterium]
MSQYGLRIPDPNNKKRVVIVGGGFGGMNLLKHLDDRVYQVVLFDRNNFHTFVPLLYQVATAGIEPDSIVDPLRNLLRRRTDTHFRMMKVLQVRPEDQEIDTAIGPLHYDYLVIATGTDANFYGNKNIESRALKLQTLQDSLNMRSRILQNFEMATLSNDEAERDRLTNFIIVGGGPTGVELAGTMAELRKYVLPRDYPELDFGIMSIYLVHSRDYLLPYIPEKAGRKAGKFLREMGVELVLNTKVTDYDGHEATLNDGRKLSGECLIWCAGVKGMTITGFPEESIERGNYVVDEFNQVWGVANVFCIGDIALQRNDAYPDGHPGVAQTAIQQGKLLGKNLMRISQGESMQAFRYVNKGTIATIGRNKAVANFLGKIRSGGWLAWFSWWVVHIYYLVGFRNKLGTLSNWILNYFSFRHSSRLIVRPFVRRNDTEEQELFIKNIDAQES